MALRQHVNAVYMCMEMRWEKISTQAAISHIIEERSCNN